MNTALVQHELLWQRPPRGHLCANCSRILENRLRKKMENFLGAQSKQFATIDSFCNVAFGRKWKKYDWQTSFLTNASNTKRLANRLRLGYWSAIHYADVMPLQQDDIYDKTWGKSP